MSGAASTGIGIGVGRGSPIMVPPGAGSNAAGAGVPTANNSLSPVTQRLIMSLFLAAIAGVAAYFCLSYGFGFLDVAKTGFETFKGGAMVYMGVAFSFVAVGNLLYGIGKAAFGDEKETYERKHMVRQIGVTTLAPLAVLPFAIYAAAMGAMAKR